MSCVCHLFLSTEESAGDAESISHVANRLSSNMCVMAPVNFVAKWRHIHSWSPCYLQVFQHAKISSCCRPYESSTVETMRLSAIWEFALWFQVWFGCKLFMTVVMIFDTLDVDTFIIIILHMIRVYSIFPQPLIPSMRTITLERLTCHL